MDSIKGIPNIHIHINEEGESTQGNKPYASLDPSEDTVELSQNKQEDKQRGFSALRATGQFINGALVDTVNGVFSIKGALALAGSAALVTAFGWPVLGILAAGGLIGGGIMTVKGVAQAISRYKKGDNEGAENAFRTMGSGTVATGLSLAGIRGLKIGNTQLAKGFKVQNTQGEKFVGTRGVFRIFGDSLRSIFTKKGHQRAETAYAPDVIKSLTRSGRQLSTKPADILQSPRLAATMKNGTPFHAASTAINGDHNHHQYLKNRLDSL